MKPVDLLYALDILQQAKESLPIEDLVSWPHDMLYCAQMYLIVRCIIEEREFGCWGNYAKGQWGVVEPRFVGERKTNGSQRK